MPLPETRASGQWFKKTVRIAGIGAMTAMLGACAALSPSVNDEQKQTLKNELQGRFGTYQDCMVAAADPYVHIESAPPSDIAEAAQASCDGAFNAYQGAVIDYFTGVVSGSARDEARTRAMQHAEDAGQQTRRQIIRRVLDQRS